MVAPPPAAPTPTRPRASLSALLALAAVVLLALSAAPAAAGTADADDSDVAGDDLPAASSVVALVEPDADLPDRAQPIAETPRGTLVRRHAPAGAARAATTYDAEGDAASWRDRDDTVVWAEPDEWVSPPPTPATDGDDGALGDDVADPVSSGMRDAGFPAAWERATGEGVTVAVVDSGVDADHAAFAGRLSDTHVDLIRDGEATEDTHGHGTLVAGVVGADGRDARYAGACWDCEIMSVRVFTDAGQAPVSRVVEGIAEAARAGADVINVSLGGQASESRARLYKAAVDAAAAEGALVVSSAGNNALDVDDYMPAGLDRVLGVAAITPGEELEHYSNHGDGVTLAAPGYARAPAAGAGTQYRRASGTSVAAPIVAGAAALVWSHNPELDADGVRNLLEATASPEVAGIGGGALDVAAALDAADHVTVAPEDVTLRLDGDDAHVTWDHPATGDDPADNGDGDADGGGGDHGADDTGGDGGELPAETVFSAEIVDADRGETVAEAQTGETHWTADVGDIPSGSRLRAHVTAETATHRSPAATSPARMYTADAAWEGQPSTAAEAAARVVHATFPAGGADGVILARDDVAADALAASSLLTPGHAVVVTPGDTVAGAALDAAGHALAVDGGPSVSCGDAAAVTVVGGPSAVSPSVEDTIAEAFGGASCVDRVAGGDRYETSAAAARLAVRGDDHVDTVVLARGDVPADAAAAAPLAAGDDAVLLLTPPDRLHPDAAAVLADLAGRDGGGDLRVVAVGGRAALSSEVTDAAGDYASVERVAGEDRYETAARLARHAHDDSEFDVVVVDGAPDASWAETVAATSLAVRADAAVVLRDGDHLPEATAQLLSEADATLDVSAERGD